MNTNQNFNQSNQQYYTDQHQFDSKQWHYQYNQHYNQPNYQYNQYHYKSQHQNYPQYHPYQNYQQNVPYAQQNNDTKQFFNNPTEWIDVNDLNIANNENSTTLANTTSASSVPPTNIKVEAWTESDVKLELDDNSYANETREEPTVAPSNVTPVVKKPSTAKTINADQLEAMLVNTGGSFICSICRYATFWRNNLRKHIVSRHMDKSQIHWYHCAHCDYKGKTKEYLIIHLQVTHNLAVRWRHCSQCDFKAKFDHLLKRHIVGNHTALENIEWLKCAQCDFKCKYKCALRKHVRRKHENVDMKIHKCQECTMSFHSRKTLRDHIIYRHTPEEQIVWYYCEFCETKFKTKKSQRWHMKLKHKSVEGQLISDIKVDDVKINYNS